MKRLLATLVAAGIVGASVMVSHAATLHVTAATLQVAAVVAEDLPPLGDPPGTTTYEIRVHVFFFRGSDGSFQRKAHVDINPEHGGSYTLSWTGPAFSGASDCSNTTRPTPPDDTIAQGLGSFLPAGSGDHVVCLRRQGNNDWNEAQSDIEQHLSVEISP